MLSTFSSSQIKYKWPKLQFLFIFIVISTGHTMLPLLGSQTREIWHWQTVVVLGCWQVSFKQILHTRRQEVTGGHGEISQTVYSLILSNSPFFHTHTVHAVVTGPCSWPLSITAHGGLVARSTAAIIISAVEYYCRARHVLIMIDIWVVIVPQWSWGRRRGRGYWLLSAASPTQEPMPHSANELMASSCHKHAIYCALSTMHNALVTWQKVSICSFPRRDVIWSDHRRLHCTAEPTLYRALKTKQW